jgi:hypothetical protein
VVKERSSADEQTAAEPDGAVDAAIMARYIRAFEEGDVDALIAVLREDVTTTMPPSPTWIQGLADHRAFYGQMFETPAGSGTVLMSEWHTVRGERLSAGAAMFDSAAFRAFVPAR